MFKAILYMKYRSTINRLKRALSRPVTYVYLIGGGLYLALIVLGLFSMTKGMKIQSSKGLVLLLTVSTLVFTPMSFISCAKRKGLNFKPADVNFLFPSPANPKLILLAAQISNWRNEIILAVVMIPVGVFAFQVVWWKMLLYFIVSIVIKGAMESAIVILLYGNERLSERAIKWIGRAIIAIIVIAFAYIVARVLLNDEKLLEVLNVLNSPFVMAIPIIGWLISIYHWILIGASTLQIVFSCMYFVTTVLMLLLAYRMKCTGEYYEKAMEYSELIDEVVQASKKGKTVIRIRTKEEIQKDNKRLKKAKINYKGNNAKALFYRQLLGYRKMRFFVFGIYNLVYLAAGVVVAIMLMTSKDNENPMLMVLGVSTYLTVLFSGMSSKWSEDLQYHYTFLLPDTNLRKLWYSTLVEHIRNLINGFLIATPVMIVCGLHPIVYICLIWLVAGIEAVKLYSNEIVLSVLAVGLGNLLRQILQIAIQTFSLAIVAVPGVLLALKFGNWVGALAMCVLLTGIVAVLLVVGSHAFERIDLADEV